jgi:hypothetical protein
VPTYPRVPIDPGDDAQPGAHLAGRDDAPQPQPQRRVGGRFASEHDSPTDKPTNGGPPPPPPRPPPSGLIASDRLEGAAQIAAFYYGDDSQKSVKRLYHAVARGLVPCGKEGGKLVASKTKILAHWDATSTNKSIGKPR